MRPYNFFFCFSLFLGMVFSTHAQEKKLNHKPFDSLLLPEHSSVLRIPFTHEAYSYYDYYMGLGGTESHTAVKPYAYKEVNRYLNLDGQVLALQTGSKTWLGRKLFNEHLVQVKDEDFWFDADFMVDLSLGKDNSEQIDYTYNNSRIFKVQGGLGKNFNFYAIVYETQARFTQYLNKWVKDNEVPNSGGLVPGRNKAKGYGENAYDFSVSEGYVSFEPSKYFEIQMGSGTNFIGDGYRSLFVSDVSVPYPYVRINTSFWRFKYTNLWMWMRDVRRPLMEDSVHARKYVSAHYLSFNVTDNFNLGFYEGIITAGDNGMDMDFLNPLLFYKTWEFSRGEFGGNGVIGFSSKWVIKKSWHLYAQFLFDEFKLSEVSAGDGWWANKYGYQVGLKKYNALGIRDLYLQGEYNRIRPYTYAHDDVLLNYGHYDQPIAHLWGGNAWEAIGIARYKKNRFFVNAKASYGVKGFDPTVEQSYGGDIYKSYNDRVYDYGNFVGQGDRAEIINAQLNTGFVVNPVLNMRIYTSLTYRDYVSSPENYYFDNGNTVWFQVGLKSNLFNWNIDF